MISYTFKIQFEDIDDVSRIIEVLASQTFEEFHHAIQTAINFDGTKPASFYIATDNWRKGKEVTTAEKEGVAFMKDVKLKDWIFDPHQKFLYITDFDVEWTLMVELFKIQKSDLNKIYPLLVKKSGEPPKQYENLNKYINTSSEFDTIAEDMIADRINDDESGMLEGEEGEDPAPGEDDELFGSSEFDSVAGDDDI
jgi:hypothetical protein